VDIVVYDTAYEYVFSPTNVKIDVKTDIMVMIRGIT